MDEIAQDMVEETKTLEPVRLSEDDLRRIVEGTVAAMGGQKQEAEAKATLERQVEELRARAEEYRSKAEAAERASLVREELRRLGVTNVELGFRAVRDDVVRRDDGALVGRIGNGEVALGEYLAKFVEANPELLPARRLGGSGSLAGGRAAEGGGLDMDSIRPGMDPAEMERARREVARVIGRSLDRL
jgi:hypothetical protein